MGRASAYQQTFTDGDGPCPASGSHKYSYDGEGRLASAEYGAVTYTYDAEGQRVGVTTSSGTTNTVFDSVTGELVQVWLNGRTAEQREFWFNGRHIGYIQSGVMTWSASDWLGSERVRTDSSGALIGSFESLPFGDGLVTESGSDNDPLHFTGKPRDSSADDIGGTNGLDYFGARYYSSTAGRWMSPDWSSTPEATPYADLTNPQSLNLYSYVLNNPLSKSDKNGHCPECLVWGDEAMQYLEDSPVGQRVGNWVGAAATAGFAAGSGLLDNVLSNLGGGGGQYGDFSRQLSVNSQTPTQPYDTGAANDLKGNSQVGDGLDVHHVPQAQPASQTVEGYDGGTAPAIALPKGEHQAIPSERGDATRTPRDQLAKDVRDLRNHTNAPNSQIQKVIEQNKQQYPEMNKPN